MIAERASKKENDVIHPGVVMIDHICQREMNVPLL